MWHSISQKSLFFSFKIRKEIIMEKGMNRREFLKATAATGTALLAGNFLQGASWAQGTVKIPESQRNRNYRYH